MLRRLIFWLSAPRHGPFKLLITAVVFIALLIVAYQAIRFIRFLGDPRGQSFLQWANGDREQRADLVTIQREACPGAPFILPADGFIGLLYGDPRGPYSSRQPHQGIDIFSNTEPGETPVYAAHDGYVTRENDWRSSLIMRVPDDPLHPGDQVWLYYTHMADQEGNDFIVDAFPPGTRDVFVEQGTLLGYTGNYNGNSSRGVWVHLHFSIVLDDGTGGYRNELEFDNTVDPSTYLGMPVHYACVADEISCSSTPKCDATGS